MTRSCRGRSRRLNGSIDIRSVRNEVMDDLERRAVAIVVIGGQTLCLLLTLLVTVPLGSWVGVGAASVTLAAATARRPVGAAPS